MATMGKQTQEHAGRAGPNAEQGAGHDRPGDGSQTADGDRDADPRPAHDHRIVAGGQGVE